MPSALEAVARPAAVQQVRLVVYIKPEHAAWLTRVQREARERGGQLTTSAIVRVALDQLRAGELTGSDPDL